MEELKFESKKIKRKVTIDGVTYEIKSPKVKDADMLFELSQDSNNLDKLKLLVDYMDRLGLPKSVSEDLDVEDFTSLCQKLFDVKKN